MNFEIAVTRLLDNEGGYVNIPTDPGGETKFGISRRAYPGVDIAALTKEQATAIYKSDFWDPLGCDRYPLSVSFQLLDFAVNAGIGTAIRKAQDALGVADDGHWGPVTIEAMRTMKPSVFTVRFAATKIRYYTKLSTWDSFGAGWMMRVANDLAYASDDLAASEELPT